MSDNRLVSFVIIAYNEADNICNTITSIMALYELGQHEIIIVDDGSHDRTADIVKAIAATNDTVRLIELGANYGRGFARDRGVSEARGEYVAIIDADIILPLDWLVRTRSAIAKNDAVGGTSVPDGDVAYLCRRFRLTPRFVRNTTTVTGSNGLYRHEVFELVSFDRRLREGEDVALNNAMIKSGLLISTVPGLVVRHQENKSFGTSLRWLFESGIGASRQLVTYREIRQPDLATGSFAVVTALGLLVVFRGHRLIGTALPAGFVMAASIQHVRSRFETPARDLPRVAPAIVADSVLLTAYFLGRLVGMAKLPQDKPKQGVAEGVAPSTPARPGA
ncbi:MAG TPA: glycosyltransferase [Streptosporangiaceae bacterium]|jgi:glycosyltransferase involved in cell wall biosynthesis|nr:glycosyltransferase [Streptosporangiaceae bacterium]